MSSSPEPDFREWGRRLLSKPRSALPEPAIYRRRRKLTAVIEHPDTLPAERQAAISALERLDRKNEIHFGEGISTAQIAKQRDRETSS